jgi:hypothetical protein
LLSRTSSAHWYHKIELNEFKQTIQFREMEEWISLHRRNDISGLHESSLEYLNLSDELWPSSVTMAPFQPNLENIIVALQSNRSLVTVSISNDVLAAIGENNQGRLFRSLGNLPTLQQMSVWGGTNAIHTRVLADALSETSNALTSLCLSRFKIGSRSEVEQLARGLKARVGSLKTLTLEKFVLDVEDKTGFLDPILLALAPVFGEPRGQLSSFSLSCEKSALNRASIVSPEALGAFFAEEQIEMPSYAFLRFRHLGLNDNHCEVIAQELARDDAREVDELDLSFNPSIGQQGYVALLGLLNRTFDIINVRVDDHKWKKTFDLVIFMNLDHQRSCFLENGVFPSKAMWLNFLAELTSTHYYDWSEQAQKLNAIWYTLREDPDLICT